MRALLVLALLATGCKEKQSAKPAETAGSAALPKAADGSGAPLPSTRPTVPSAPISIEEAQSVLPAIEGTQIIALKQTKDHGQVHGTWCIDGTSADDVAKKVGQWMAQAKFENLTIRGDARKAGVVGDRGTMRLSMVVSASSAQVCAAPAHYFASATIYKPGD